MYLPRSRAPPHCLLDGVVDVGCLAHGAHGHGGKLIMSKALGVAYVKVLLEI